MCELFLFYFSKDLITQLISAEELKIIAILDITYLKRDNVPTDT